NYLEAIGPGIPGQPGLASAGSGTMTSGSVAGGFNYLADFSTSAHTLTGGGGSDSLYSVNSSGDTLIAGSGDDQTLQSLSTGDNLMTAGANAGAFDSLYAGAGNDTLDASLDPNFAALYSGSGNSTLDGGTNATFGEYFGIANQGNGSDTVTINTAVGSG